MFIAPLFSGSSGNATLIEIGGVRLLVDAGKSCRAILSALALIGVEPQSISAMLITHEHIDHISGVGALSRRFDIPVYANAATWEGMGCVGNISTSNQRIFETGRDFYIGSAHVFPFATPHDAAESVGYSFTTGSRRISVMTDIGHVDKHLLDSVAGSDILLIEANHDPELVRSCRYPYVTKRRILSDHGHLSNENCGKALCSLYTTGVRNVILGHLSQDNNFESLALETVRGELIKEDISPDAVSLCVAHRDRVTGVFKMED